MIDTIYLLNRGFEIRQINQLVAIEELGYNLSEISVTTSVDQLKEFKKIITDNKYPEWYMNRLQELCNKGYDVKLFLEKEWDSDCFDYLASMLKANIDISKIDKNFDRNQIKELYVGTCRFGLDIPYLMNYKIPATLMGNTISVLNNKKFKYGPIVREIFDSNLEINSIKTLISALYKSIDQDKEIDIRPIINDKYNTRQLDIIIRGYFEDKNILDYCDERYSYLQMSCVLTGLLNDLDISLFNKLRYNEYQMETILEWMTMLEDKNDINAILNEKLSPAQMELLMSRKTQGIDIDKFCDDKYTYEQMYAIYSGIKKGLNVDIYRNTELSGEEMYTVMNALKMQKEGYDIDMFLDKNITLKAKIENLISKLNISNINLNNDSLDEKVAPKDNLNNFYRAYKERDDDEIIEVIFKDGKKMILEPEDFDVPSNPIALFDDDYCKETYFVEKYQKEIEKIVEILSFIKYEDFQYHLYNLLENEKVETLELCFEGSEDYEIDCAYEGIMEDTVNYLSGYEEYYYSPLFFDLNDLAKCGGPDQHKLMLQRPMYAFCTTMYTIAKDCKTEDISNIKKLFDDIYLQYYAFYAGDCFSYKMLDKNDDIIQDGKWYGSFNLEERIKKEFGIDVIEIKDDHENYESEELEYGWEYEEDEYEYDFY